jgi:hypothetical protein
MTRTARNGYCTGPAAFFGQHAGKNNFKIFSAGGYKPAGRVYQQSEATNHTIN